MNIFIKNDEVKLSQEDFIYGCKSGIQKAIRRGDIALASKCFDSLWDAGKDFQKWLFDRMPIIMQEESPILIGELAEYFEHYSVSVRDELKFWYLYMARMLKSKDANACFASYLHRQRICPSDSPALKATKDIYGKMDKRSPKSVLNLTWDIINAERRNAEAPIDKYESGALCAINNWIARGRGGCGERMSMLACMVEICDRGLVKEEVVRKEKLIHNYDSMYENNQSLPWWCLDMHTRVGLQANSRFMKQYKKDYEGLTWEKFRKIWFFLESAHIPKKQMIRTTEENAKSMFDSYLWDQTVNEIIPFGHFRFDEVRTMWREMREKLHWKILEVAEERRSLG